jgi:hypothetical protein
MRFYCCVPSFDRNIYPGYLFIKSDRDTPEVDIAGANLYQRFVERLRNGDLETPEFASIPSSRTIPASSGGSGVQHRTIFDRQTVEKVVPILVCTGVYRPPTSADDERVHLFHGHRDFRSDDFADLCKPEVECADVLHAVDYILTAEGVEW